MSVVFTDSFTVSVDTDIAAYPAGSPDYAYSMGAPGALSVNAANDRVQVTGAQDTDFAAYITDPAAPTADQQITLDFGFGGDFVGGNNPAVRFSTDNYYVGMYDPPSGACNIYRVSSSGFTSIASSTVTTGISTGTKRMKATGTNPVALEFQVNALATLIFSDSDAARKQSGPPGIHMYDDAAPAAWLDNISVDNLVSVLNHRRLTCEGHTFFLSG